MLQTLKGKSALENSIPRIKEEFIEPICSKKEKGRRFERKAFSLKGKQVLISPEKQE